MKYAALYVFITLPPGSYMVEGASSFLESAFRSRLAQETPMWPWSSDEEKSAGSSTTEEASGFTLPKVPFPESPFPETSKPNWRMPWDKRTNATTTSTTVTTIKPPWKIPEDPTKDRLNDDHCKEPKVYRRTDYAGAFGPEKIFCCHTALQVIADIRYRCKEECNDAVPCSKAMEKKYCPMYLKAYQKEADRLCAPRPTTTTTTTTTVTTTPAAAKVRQEDVVISLGTTTTTTDPLEWCYDMCAETMVEAHGEYPDECDVLVRSVCKGFCQRAANSGVFQPDWFPPQAPAPAAFPFMSPGPAGPGPAPGPVHVEALSPAPAK